jgi:hypothetical protein
LPGRAEALLGTDIPLAATYRFTVKGHSSNLLAEIDARDRAQAVAFAYQRRLAPAREQPG